MCLHVCPSDFLFVFDSRLAIFGKETVLLAFCVFDCDAVTLSASVFPFDVLDERP